MLYKESDGEYSHSGFVTEVFEEKYIGALAAAVKEARETGKEVTVSLANDKYKITGDTTPIGLARTVAYHRTKQFIADLEGKTRYFKMPEGEIAHIGEDLHQTIEDPSVAFASIMDTNLAIVAYAAQAMPKFKEAMATRGVTPRSARTK